MTSRRRFFVQPLPKPPGKSITPESLAASGTEHGHQSAVFCWIQQTGQHKYPELNRLFAIPNGGQRHKAVAGKLKIEGVKPGVLDLMLPIPRGGNCGLFLEMKKPGKLESTSDAQDDWICFLQDNYQCEVCDNWEMARDVLIQYLESGPTRIS